MNECCECGECKFSCSRCEGCLESVCDECGPDHECVLSVRDLLGAETEVNVAEDINELPTTPWGD